jgi:predicted RNase H-like nuclease
MRRRGAFGNLWQEFETESDVAAAVRWVKMRAVLGIDAAWTLTQPSGVALARQSLDGWHLVAVASSYQRFLSFADEKLEAEQHPLGSAPDAQSLLATACALCRRPVDLVAVDMPLAHSPIIGRRTSDNAVSRAYGGRKCGTHTPSTLRPGPISDALRQGFERAGYPLLTAGPVQRGIIEVYPHPALVELAEAIERLPYKAAKVSGYWPCLSPSERRKRLYAQWHQIVTRLESEIAGVGAAVPQLALDANSREIKGYEDMLDAIVCVWVGICTLEGRATPFGDEQSAIWIPNARGVATSGGAAARPSTG